MLFGRFDLGAADVLGRVGRDAAVDVGEAVVTAHRRESPIDRRGCEASLFHRGSVNLDVGTRGIEHGEVLVGGPLEVVAQVVAIGLQCSAAVPSEERSSRHLGFVGRPRWIVGAKSGVVDEQCGHGVLFQSWDIHTTPSPSLHVWTSTHTHQPAVGGGRAGLTARVSDLSSMPASGLANRLRPRGVVSGSVSFRSLGSPRTPQSQGPRNLSDRDSYERRC